VKNQQRKVCDKQYQVRHLQAETKKLEKAKLDLIIKKN
jgi:hypothetical protein